MQDPPPGVRLALPHTEGDVMYSIRQVGAVQGGAEIFVQRARTLDDGETVKRTASR
jgi:hypothetical protein